LPEGSLEGASEEGAEGQAEEVGDLTSILERADRAVSDVRTPDEEAGDVKPGLRGAKPPIPAQSEATVPDISAPDVPALDLPVPDLPVETPVDAALEDALKNPVKKPVKKAVEKALDDGLY